MSKLKRVFLLLVIAGSFLSITPTSAEEEITPGTLVSVFGEADVRVVSGNFIVARKDAMNSALKEAILHVVRMLLPAEDIPKEFRVSEPEDLPGEITELMDQINLEETIEGMLDGVVGEDGVFIAEEGELNKFLIEGSTEELDAELDDNLDVSLDEDLDEGSLDDLDAELGDDLDIGLGDDLDAELGDELDEEPEEDTEEQILVREVVEKEILSRGLDFVQSYKFINEGISEDEANYYMNVEFTFFISHLSRKLTEGGLNVEGAQGPKILLLVDESAISRIQGASFLLLPSATEENLLSAIKAQGYAVIPREEVRKLGNSERVELAMGGDLDAVRWLREAFEAEYIILATATSKSFPMRGKRSPYVYGEIDAKIYKGESLELLWEKRIVKKLEGSSGTATFQSVRMASKIFREKVIDFLYNQEVQ